MTRRPFRIVVIGAGMVGSRLVEDLLAAESAGALQITQLGSEVHRPYNRVLLSDVIAGRTPVASLALPNPGAFDDARLDRRLGTAAIRLDRTAGLVHASDGSRHPFDAVVFATGATAVIPALGGLRPRPTGVQVLRSIDDARDIVGAAANAASAVVIGTGVLGLEVALGLTKRCDRVALVGSGNSVMRRQLDEATGLLVGRRLAELGIDVHCSAGSPEIRTANGQLRAVHLQTATGAVELNTDLLVLACGTTPDVRIARDAGLPVNSGVIVDHRLISPADARISAIGDCAEPPEGATGLIAQGWDQARRMTATLLAAASSEAARPPEVSGPGVGLRGTDVVRVKADGLDLVTFGVRADQVRHRPELRRVRVSDPDAGRLLEVVVDGATVIGGVCLGSGRTGTDLVAAYTRGTPTPIDPVHLLVPTVRGPAAVANPIHLPADTTVCTCNGVTKAEVVGCWNRGARTVGEVAARCRATTGCGGCRSVVGGLLDWLADSDPDQPPEQPEVPLLGVPIGATS